MTHRVNGKNIVVQAFCPGLVYLITTGTAVTIFGDVQLGQFNIFFDN